MQQDSATFWTDIKIFEEQLTKNPDSFCFAKLSEIYRAVGLVDDALQTARQGVLRHPDYLAGQRSLALACHAKGLNNECLQALQRVTAALPEDAPSQKLLARLYVENGDQASALDAYRVLSEFEPDDVECRLGLAALENLSCTSDTPDSEWDDDDEIIEDLEIVEDDECEAEYQAELPAEVSALREPETVADVPPPESDHDPLSTATVAELYVTQGYIQRALEIYRSILNDDPDNGQVRARIAALELQALVAVTAAEHGAAVSCEQEADDDEAEENYYKSGDEFQSGAGVGIEPFDSAVTEELPPVPAELTEAVELPVSERSAPLESIRTEAEETLTLGNADRVVSELETCLDNIRRIKACR